VWLTRAHWGPLALQDHGDAPLTFDAKQPVCLIGANVAFRRSVFGRVGLFSPAVQRVKDGIGSTEDHELLLRLYAAGGRALYLPDLLVTTEVPQERLTREYHRRWHRGHGRFHALMRIPSLERSTRGRLLGVPAHLFRTAVADAAAWAKLRVQGDAAEAFTRETRLWFFSGFLQERAWSHRR
jgi:cellulose synthase/poly-beta-1,6-N-acetylglucosamine synthase-like glycosyltransferase